MTLQLSPQELRQRVNSLPPEVRSIYSSEEAVDAIRAVGEQRGLTVDQLAKLESLVSEVLLGLLSVGKFAAAVQENLKVDQEQSSYIVNQIEEHIFKPVRAVLIRGAQQAKMPPLRSEEVASSPHERSWTPPGVPIENVQAEAETAREVVHPYASGDPYKESVDDPGR